MDLAQAKGPFCQSCGMPMVRSEDFATNADGTKSSEYCRFCFQKGKFTDPGITMEQMIDKVAGFMVQMRGLTKAKAKEMTKSFVPNLKRWKKQTARP